MLRVLHVNVRHSVLLTASLPYLHTLGLRFYGTLLREVNLQYLFSGVPALRQLVVECEHDYVWGENNLCALDRWDVEALVGLQCQQLDLLTVDTSIIDDHTMNLLACIQCPLKLSIDIKEWSLLESAPP